jgi:hypothetical protein
MGSKTLNYKYRICSQLVLLPNFFQQALVGIMGTSRSSIVLCLVFLAASGAAFGQKPKSAVVKTPPAKAALTKPPTIAANPAIKDTAIVRLFTNPLLIKWNRVFKGRVDDGAMVEISLGYDGKKCLGFLTYTKSRTRFVLEGTIDSAGFQLEEHDMAREQTGNIRGSILGRHFEAEWSNADNTVGCKIEAEEVPPGQALTLNCNDNKWSSRYVTRFNNARCDMVLIRAQNGALDGFLWVEFDARTYRLKGDIKADGKYEMEVLGSEDRLVAMLSGMLKAGQNTDCNWTGSGERRQLKFVLKDHFLLGCYEYADYACAYDVLYPRTPCAACNTWLDDQVNAWVERCKGIFSAKKIPLVPINRNAQRASAWPEIGCWTDNLFSGYLTFVETWSEQAQGIAYNFDLRTGKEILLEDLFQKSFNHKVWMSEYATKEMPKISAFAADPAYREWLAKEGFPLVLIRREGLEMSTLFHPQYGRQTIFVPYKILKPNLRKDSAIAEFIK